jgi:tRNA1(Val) A37 N6-methylase TrmN6
MEGRLALIIPCDLRTDLLRIAAIHGFWLTRETIVHSTPEKSPFRVLVELSRRKSTAFIQTDLIIRNAPGGSYTEEFKELTRDYYLAF